MAAQIWTHCVSISAMRVPVVRSPDGATLTLNSIWHACLSFSAPAVSVIFVLSSSNARLWSTRLMLPTRAVKHVDGCTSAGDVLNISMVTLGVSAHETVVGLGVLPSYAVTRIGGSVAPSLENRGVCSAVGSLLAASSPSSFHVAYAIFGSPATTLKLISGAANARDSFVARLSEMVLAHQRAHILGRDRDRCSVWHCAH